MSGYVLPMPVTPFPDESLPGVVMRNAEPYHFRTPMRLFARLRLKEALLWPVCQSDPDGELGSQLRHLMGLDEETYRRLSPWSADETRTSILGHQVWRELVPSDRRAVCPQCLRDSPHHRAVWQIAALPVCAIHGVRLIERCPNPECGKPLKWSGQSHCECEWRGCRFDLRKADADPVDMGAIPGVGRLLSLFRCDGVVPPTPLNAPVGEVLTLAFMLGRVALGFERQARPVGLIDRERARVPEMMEAGCNALDDWPRGFHALLSARKMKATGQRGVKQVFGKLSLQVHRWSREPWGAPIGQAFAEFATSQPDLPLSSKRLKRYAPGAELRQTHMSIAQAAEFLKVSPGAVLRLMNRRGLFVLEPQGMGVPSLIKADDVKALATAMNDWLLPEETRKMLGLGWKLVQELEAGGVIPRRPEVERLMDYKPFLRSDVEALLAACIGKAPTVSVAEADKMGLTKITHAKAPGHSVVQICHALVAKRLRSRATVGTAKGLLRIRLDMAEVRQALDAGRETLSIVDAARTISAKWTNLHVWVRRGLLKATKTGVRGERGLRIHPNEWAAFRADFVAGSDLTGLFRQEANYWLSRHLLHQGVKPVSGPGVDEAETFLFRRSDCNPAVVRAIRAVQARPVGSAQDKHRAAFAKAERVGAVIAASWGCHLKRTNNFFEDTQTGRVVQIVSGRRPDLTGVFRFMLQSTSVTRLARMEDAWVALVPAQGGKFLLLPFPLLEWRGEASPAQYVTVGFDVHGEPKQFADYAVALPPEDCR